MKVKVIEEYEDLKEKRYPIIGEILDVSNERGKLLISKGKAIEVESEYNKPQSSDTYAVKDEPEYYRKSKRSRGVTDWETNQ